jgi:hypothetical protein
MNRKSETGDVKSEEKVGGGVITGAFIRISRVAFGHQQGIIKCYCYCSSESRMLCIQTLIVLLLLSRLTSYICQTRTRIKSYICLHAKLHLCGIGVCGHLELHLGDSCCWVKSLGAGLGALSVSTTRRLIESRGDIR